MRVERTAEVLGYVECLDVWLPEDDERWLAYVRIGGKLVFNCFGLRRAGVQRIANLNDLGAA